jgi:hypothetical protein
MTIPKTLDRRWVAANEVHPDLLTKTSAVVPAIGLFTALLLCGATDAQAVDGCEVLLCLASGNWRGIQQCVPPVQQVLRDLARGRPLPTCEMGGVNNGAEHAWANPPTFCPPQYTHYDPDLLRYSCDYAGAISVTIEGALWTHTWWTFNGDAVTEFTPAAKAQLGTWDARFEADYAAWAAAQNPPCEGC